MDQQKNLLLSFHIVNVEKADVSLTFPLLRLLQGIRWPGIFSCYLCLGSSPGGRNFFL